MRRTANPFCFSVLVVAAAGGLGGCEGNIGGGSAGMAAGQAGPGTGSSAGPSGVSPGGPGSEFGPGGACDMGAIFSKPANGCTNAQCHGALYQGGLDLLSAGVEARLVGAKSATDACRGQPLVDAANPDNSLMLRVIDPVRFAMAGCGVPMPFGSSAGVSPEDLACFEGWVKAMAASALPPDDEPPAEFEPVAPATYVNKVKTLLTGLAPTPEEATGVAAEPGALAGLVRGWLETPEFERKLLELFRVALQQRIAGTGTLNTQFMLLRGENTRLAAFRNNLEEAFVRTAADLVASGRPFTEILTTRRWAATTATLSALSFLEYTAQELKGEKHLLVRDPGPDQPAPPWSLTYSANNRAWHLPALPANCTTGQLNGDLLLEYLIGFVNCPAGVPAYRFKETALGDDDFQDWRFVDLTTASSAADVPRFYDIAKLRTLTSLPLRQPRQGFFSTPAFLANWDTNEDNQFRVTTSQTLIVALGEIFSPADATQPVSQAGLAKEHAEPGTTCYGCHQFLDPMREYFAKSFSFTYQFADKPSGIAPSFAFQGLVRDGGDLFDFSASLAAHPKFASGWVQKLCYWANSQPCAEADPEFLRVAQSFAASGFDFKTLLVELMTSPLVTGASFVETYRHAEPLVSITRKQHLCQLLDARLGVQDTCSSAASFAGLVPEDEFARGSAEPVQTAVTGLFHYAAAEKLCVRLATRLVGSSETSRFKTAAPEAVLDELTQALMGLPAGHPRHEGVRAQLGAHYAAAAQDTNTLTALRSTFAVACVSPDVMALGL